jgi:hypothetical protein
MTELLCSTGISNVPKRPTDVPDSFGTRYAGQFQILFSRHLEPANKNIAHLTGYKLARNQLG